MRLGWDRVEPVLACTSPDGHSSMDLITFGSEIPEGVICGNCGEAYTVVTFPMDADRPGSPPSL